MVVPADEKNHIVDIAYTLWSEGVKGIGNLDRHPARIIRLWALIDSRIENDKLKRGEDNDDGGSYSASRKR
jgi:hypothetical protein